MPKKTIIGHGIEVETIPKDEKRIYIPKPDFKNKNIFFTFSDGTTEQLAGTLLGIFFCGIAIGFIVALVFYMTQQLITCIL